MTRSSDQKKNLRGLFYAATLGSKAAAEKVKQAIEALRVGRPRRKPAAPRKAAPIIRKVTPAARPAAAVKAPQGDNGSSLMAARAYADRVRLHARILASAPNRNATPAEITFCKLARTLPARRPNDSTPLREWRAYAAAVESLKAAINKTKVTF
jgi:hypothetical protein